MRRVGVCLVGLLVAFTVAAQDDPLEIPTLRYDLEANFESYAQGTPKEALGSVLKAIDRGRYDYLVAHLMSPELVDRRIKETKTTFAMVVNDVQTRIADDPEALKELRKFFVSGEFSENGDMGTSKLKDVKTRTVNFKKIGKRWFMENRRMEPNTPVPEKKEN